MSSGTTKEITSNVESSVTMKLDAEKLEIPEKSSSEAKKDNDPPWSNKEGHKNLIDDSKFVVDEKIYGTRYFIIKSLNYDNIQLSVEKGIWATQVMNERILEEAFNNSQKVILIFSVNASGFFQGYAEMMSSVGRRRDSVWSQGASANSPWGRSFKVKWLRLSNLPFYKTLHLKNPLNEFKPVKISRDCQELPLEIGAALCELIDCEPEENPNLNRGTCNTSSMDMTWAAASMFHPSLFYNYHPEASRWHLGHGSVPAPECLPVMPSTGALIRYPNRKGNMRDSPAESDVSSQVDSWPVSGEICPVYSTFTEDDLLEMSYEEYVEAHARLTNQLHQPLSIQASGQSQRKEGSSSKEHDSDDLQSHSGHVKSRKRSRSRSRSRH